MNQEFGTTFIITSHSLEEISKLFTRLLILKAGKLVLNVDKQELEQYCSIRGKLGYNKDLGISSLTQNNLFLKRDEEYIDATGSIFALDELKKQLSGVEWSDNKKVTVEDIYLAANQAIG
jgi:ABC-type multidrug transport system ATPase subunit